MREEVQFCLGSRYPLDVVSRYSDPLEIQGTSRVPMEHLSSTANGLATVDYLGKGQLRRATNDWSFISPSDKAYQFLVLRKLYHYLGDKSTASTGAASLAQA